MKLRIVAVLTFFTSTVFSQSYHDTQGKLEISNSGQASYTLPIAMPPSIDDVGPVINLSYSSGASGGIAGQGWNINSVSTVSRIATRYDVDGFKDGVDFDSNDKLALDGQRLLIKTGTYWADGSIYETEVQSNTKIELKGTGTSMYFIVTNPDGSRSWYGNYAGNNAVEPTAYYITRFEDTNGNFILYNYSNITNRLYISDIQFSGNNITNPTPINKIVFTYKTSARTENVYIKGLKIEKNKILDKIEVFTNNFLFKKYQVTHTTDSYGYQRVSQLQEFNTNNEPSNPVVFEYNSSNNSVTETEISYTDTFNANSDITKITGDFDGDGKIDFMSNNQIFTNLFQGNGGVTIELPFSVNQDRFITATTLTNNRLNQKQSIVKIEETISDVNLKFTMSIII